MPYKTRVKLASIGSILVIAFGMVMLVTHPQTSLVSGQAATSAVATSTTPSAATLDRTAAVPFPNVQLFLGIANKPQVHVDVFTGNGWAECTENCGTLIVGDTTVSLDLGAGHVFYSGNYTYGVCSGTTCTESYSASGIWPGTPLAMSATDTFQAGGVSNTVDMQLMGVYVFAYDPARPVPSYDASVGGK